MHLNLNKLSDQFISWNLKKIAHGYLELIDAMGIDVAQRIWP